MKIGLLVLVGWAVWVPSVVCPSAPRTVGQVEECAYYLEVREGLYRLEQFEKVSPKEAESLLREAAFLFIDDHFPFHAIHVQWRERLKALVRQGHTLSFIFGSIEKAFQPKLEALTSGIFGEAEINVLEQLSWHSAQQYHNYRGYFEFIREHSLKFYAAFVETSSIDEHGIEIVRLLAEEKKAGRKPILLYSEDQFPPIARSLREKSGEKDHIIILHPYLQPGKIEGVISVDKRGAERRPRRSNQR